MSEQTQLSPAQLVNQIRSSYGMTWDEMGAAMGRSGRMMRSRLAIWSSVKP